VLFVCIQNAGRSQTAQAFAERAGIEARSSGSAPATCVHPEVVEAMREREIDLAGRVPRALHAVDVEWADVVVTMGCGDACPVLPDTDYVDWALEDPHGMGVDGVREVRDRIERLVGELAAAGS
jgi:protein-tyrosine-phosphatase